MSMLDREQHVVQDCEFVRYCRRELRQGDDLMSFYVPAEERWVIAFWRNKDHGDVFEIASFGLGGPDHTTFMDVKLNCNPEVKANGLRRWLRQQREAREAFQKKWQETRAKRKDFAKFLKKTTPNQVARDDPNWNHFGV